MNTHIALLRGINVSGYNKIKMVELKLLLESLDFHRVVTYIQSGNIVFESKIEDCSALEGLILEAIKTKFGYEINCIVLTKEQLSRIFTSNPYLERNAIDIKKLCVTVLKTTPDLEGLAALQQVSEASGDEFQLVGDHIFMHLPNGFARTKLTNNLVEKKLKTPATTRNWRTITKLVELSQASE